MEQTIFRAFGLRKEARKLALSPEAISRSNTTHIQTWQQKLNPISLFRLLFAVDAQPPQNLTTQSQPSCTNRKECEAVRTGNHRQFTGSAIVDEQILPGEKGYVRFRAGWWLAQCDREVILHPGDIVDAIGIQELTLIVRPRSY